MKITRLLALAAVFCGITASAVAQGFSPESVREFFRKKSPASEPNAIEELLLVELWGKAGQFRKMAVDEPKLDSWKRSALVRPGALDRLEQGKITPVYRELWNWVLMGSQPILGNTLGDAPVVAFYNPFIDAALLTTWTHVDDKGWKMADAVPVTGAAFVAHRASSNGDRPGYGKAAGGFEDKLVANSRRFVASFEAAYPPFGRADRGVPASEDSVRAALKYIEEGSYALIGMLVKANDLKQPDSFGPLIRSFAKALSADSSKRLAELLGEESALKANAIFRIKQPVRERMMPYLAVGKVVIFADPYVTDAFLALRVGENATDSWIASAGYYRLAR